MWYQLELWRGWEAKVSTWVVNCLHDHVPHKSSDTKAEVSLLVGNTPCVLLLGAAGIAHDPTGRGRLTAPRLEFSWTYARVSFFH